MSGPQPESPSEIIVVLAGAPMGKERVRVGRTKGGAVRTYTPERTVNYESRIAWAAQQEMAGRPLLTGPVEVDIVAVFPIAPSWPKKRQEAARSGIERPVKKPDLDNVMKILCDGLNLVAWADDAQIVDGRVRKWYGDQPRLAIRIRSANRHLTIPSWASQETRDGGRSDAREHSGADLFA